MNSTSPLCFFDAASKSGISSRHGGQDGYQKLITTGVPSKSDSLTTSPWVYDSLPNTSSSKPGAASLSSPLVASGASVLVTAASPPVEGVSSPPPEPQAAVRMATAARRRMTGTLVLGRFVHGAIGDMYRATLLSQSRLNIMMPDRAVWMPGYSRAISSIILSAWRSSRPVRSSETPRPLRYSSRASRGLSTAVPAGSLVVASAVTFLEMVAT